MPQGQTSWTPNVLPVFPARVAVDEEEALLGVSTSFFQHSLAGVGSPRATAARSRTPNNRLVVAGRPTQNLTFGTITARNAPRFQAGAQFGANLNTDVVFGYDPHALRDPDEYETLLYQRPRRWDQLSTLPAPPNIAAITGTIRTRSTWSEFLGGFIQTQLTVNPSAYQDPPDPPGSVTRPSQVRLPYSPDPTPPPFASDRIPAEVLPHPPSALTPVLPFSPAPTPPRVATDQTPPEVLPHPPLVVQNLPFAVVVPPNPPPVIASNRIPAETLPHPASVVPALRFTPAPTPPPFTIGPRGFDEGPRPGKVVQALQFSPAPTPPPFTTDRIPAEVLPHLSSIFPALRFTPAPVPPPFGTNKIPAEVLAHGPSVIQAPLTALPFKILPEQGTGGSGTEEGFGGYGFGQASAGSGTEEGSGIVTVGSGSGTSGPE